MKHIWADRRFFWKGRCGARHQLAGAAVMLILLGGLVPATTNAGAGAKTPTHPRTLEEIRKTLADIQAAPAAKLDAAAAEREAALRRLRVHRYLAGVPDAKVALDDKLNQYAQAAARLCEKIGRVDHKPPNPGWPEEEYRIALKGCGSSNLYVGFGDYNLSGMIDGFVDDSDEHNIDRMGHRRWCLNPLMGNVGFGRAGKFAAMWAFDQSAASVPDFDFVCYPARGYMPLEHFSPQQAWTISLNPKKFKAPPAKAQPKIYPWDAKTKEKGEPLPLNFTKVDNIPFGIPNCIIFRPDKNAIAAGRTYVVEIDGLTTAGGGPTSVRYVVEFVRLTESGE